MSFSTHVCTTSILVTVPPPDLMERFSTITVGVRSDYVVSLDEVYLRVVAALDLKTRWLMTFVNPATAIAAYREPILRNLLSCFDLVAPDGIGMVHAMSLRHRKVSQRVSFDSTSLAPLIFELAAGRNLSVAFVGGRPGVGQIARDRVNSVHPDTKIIDAYHGYMDWNEVIASLIVTKPDIVVVGMGSIKQERFLLQLADSGWVGLGFTCGGYFDQLAACGMHYYPGWIDRLDLRWAYRLVMEPRRLGRRYLLEYPEFCLRLAIDLVLLAIRAR